MKSTIYAMVYNNYFLEERVVNHGPLLLLRVKTAAFNEDRLLHITTENISRFTKLFLLSTQVSYTVDENDASKLKVDMCPIFTL